MPRGFVGVSVSVRSLGWVSSVGLFMRFFCESALWLGGLGGERWHGRGGALWVGGGGDLCAGRTVGRVAATCLTGGIGFFVRWCARGCVVRVFANMGCGCRRVRA